MAEKPKRIPVRLDPERLSKPASRLLGKIGDGRVCCEHREDERLQDGIAYWIEPGGAYAAPEDVRELQTKGRIVPIRDGLFEGDTQTWRPA